MVAFLNEIGPELALRAGATDSAIEQAQMDLAWTFPSEYAAFLRASNGAVGMLASGDYIDLWPVEELIESNRRYQFPKYCPEAIAFGSNGGGEAFAFRRSNGHIAVVPFIGMGTRCSDRRRCAVHRLPAEGSAGELRVIDLSVA